jgi:hypothetical protein
MDHLSSLNDQNNAILESDIPPLMGNIIQIIRFSLGDFDFNIINTANFGKFEVQIFWISWLFIVMITNIVFLTFIIAEVVNSYEKV